MTKASPRHLAGELLREVWANGAYANLAWEKLLADCPLSTEEKSFATHLAYGTLRHSGTIDRIISHASTREKDTIEPEVWWQLQLGSFQWLWMRTPAHAVVNETVRVTKNRGLHRASGLVNAVMRKITKKPLEEWLQDITAETDTRVAALALEKSHPEWIVSALIDALADSETTTPDEISDLLDANNTPATPTLALLPGLARYKPSDVRTSHSPYGVVAPSGSPGADPRVRSGQARVQDEGSQLAALVVTEATPLGAGEKLLDMCSGPGGKAALIAALAAQAGAHLTAVELAPHRAKLVEQALSPLADSPNPPSVITGDARESLGGPDGHFDRVLLDAPCTGLGALRRRPESRWRKTEADLEGLIALQRSLIAEAIRVTAPGGLIVYVTCSPVVQETTDLVAWALDNHPVSALDTASLLKGISQQPLTGHQRGSAVQLWPHRHQTDAMFIQALRRTS
jgi:16S rRNA (cytosine967-C5)-methyltransferase